MPGFDALPLFDPYTSDYETDPHAVHHAVRSVSPVAQHPFGLAVLGYEQVQAVLRDRRFVNPPGLALRMFGITDGPIWDRVTTNIVDIDGDEHARLRRLVAQAFTPRAADDLRLAMRTAMCELIESAGDEFDLAELVETYPIAVICSLLDVPRRDWTFISRNTEDVFRIFLPTVADHQALILAALEDMDAYLDHLIEQRHREGLTGADLVTQLLTAEEHDDRLTIPEVRMLVSSVLGAGTDTTRNQLAAGIHAFLDHPDQWALLRADPSLVGSAVNEIIRHDPIVQGIFRHATTDARIGDVDVPAGTIVHVVTGAANRDPEVFAEPDQFDITRNPAAPVLTFGGGIHYCLGVHLAKAELAEALTQMTAAWTDLTRAGPALWKPRNGVSGPMTLPIAVGRTSHETPELGFPVQQLAYLAAARGRSSR